MKVNKICLIGILIYLYPIIKYRSYRALIIFTNGLMYHGFFADNYYVLGFDVFCNFLISVYSLYTYPHTFLPGLCSVILFLLNDLLYHKCNIKSNIIHINHVLLVQLPFMYLICDSMY
mgnify:CR=1 FL=1